MRPDRPSRREPVSADGEFAFSNNDFKDIAALLHAESGISLSDAKAPLVYSRLVKRLRALGLENFRDYCALVTSPNNNDERRRMVAALTTNVTRFFREPHHFDHLRAKVLPRLIAEARRGGRVRIWSAGCSSGEEPYSIAITLLSMLPDAHRYDIKILATDIDPGMLRQGKGGRYSAAAVAPIEANLRARWLEAVPGRGGETAWKVKEPLQALVTFRELNLMAAWPMKGNFQVIFCRNVVIYFSADDRASVLTQISGKLADEGLLYIGHSERLTPELAPGFQTAALTTYQKKLAS